METALLIAQLLNTATPGIANLIILAKRKDGTIDVVTLLDEADEKFQESIDRGKAWLAANPKQ
jgi:hypothetical protein